MVVPLPTEPFRRLCPAWESNPHPLRFKRSRSSRWRSRAFVLSAAPGRGRSARRGVGSRDGWTRTSVLLFPKEAGTPTTPHLDVAPSLLLRFRPLDVTSFFQSGCLESNQGSRAPHARMLSATPHPDLQERPAGFEPAHPPWRGGRLPLHHGRVSSSGGSWN
jgi:hypothetical protein